MTIDLARLESSLTSTRLVRDYHFASGSPDSLLAAVHAITPQLSPSEAIALVHQGAVYINGIRAIEDLELTFPCSVEVFLPKANHRANLPLLDWDDSQVIFEDRELLVVFKPTGLPCLPTRDQQSINLKVMLERYVGAPVHMPSRLDTATSGLVVTSKAAEFHRAVQHSFELKGVTKSYLLEVSPKVSWSEISTRNSIGRDRRHQILRKVVESGGREAQTHFTLLEQRLESSLLCARPQTGRTHQIRVHSQFLGHSIIGDNFYAGIEADSLHLFANQISLNHPRTNEFMTFMVPQGMWPEWAMKRKDQ